jgi:hypothetical protein
VVHFSLKEQHGVALGASSCLGALGNQQEVTRGQMLSTVDFGPL